MFLQQLTHKEKLAFDALARHLAASDGTLAPQELALLEQLRFELALGEDVAPDARSVTTLAADFTTPRGRRIALLELLGLAHVDREFHPTESDFLRQIARAWDVSETELLVLDGWTLRMLAVVREAETLLEGKV